MFVCRGTGRGVCRAWRDTERVCFVSNLSEGLAPCVHAFKVVTFRTNTLVLQTRLPTFGMQGLVVAGQSLRRMCGRVWPVRLHAGQGPKTYK